MARLERGISMSQVPEQITHSEEVFHLKLLLNRERQRLLETQLILMRKEEAELVALISQNARSEPQ